jgi:hypothetical protein
MHLRVYSNAALLTHCRCCQLWLGRHWLHTISLGYTIGLLCPPQDPVGMTSTARMAYSLLQHLIEVHWTAQAGDQSSTCLTLVALSTTFPYNFPVVLPLGGNAPRPCIGHASSAHTGRHPARPHSDPPTTPVVLGPAGSAHPQAREAPHMLLLTQTVPGYLQAGSGCSTAVGHNITPGAQPVVIVVTPLLVTCHVRPRQQE